MRKVYILIILNVLLLFTSNCIKAADYLEECFKKQAAPLENRYFAINYSDLENAFYHSPNPWDVIEYKKKGCIWLNNSEFIQSDTVINRNEPLVSKIQFNNDCLLIEVYWKDGLLPVTPEMLDEQPIEAARYSPVLLLSHFNKNKHALKVSTENNLAVYSLEINKSIVKLFIDKNDFLLDKITVLNYNDMLGDVLTSYNYSNHTLNDKLYFAKNVEIIKAHNTIDSVTISFAGFVNVPPQLLEKPTDYKIEPKHESEPEAVTEKISPNIYTITLPHCQTMTALAEFKEFIVAIDAPLSCENGELIIRHASKINPDKPIKYFVFGHHHPWSLGGIRPFIHIGATIVCRNENIDYIKYLSDASHSLKPDSLYLQPKPLKTELADSVKIISDGDYEMGIYLLGNKSVHTNDYSFMYFPKEKIVFEGCLVWIPLVGEIKKAGKRQEGLYNGIKYYGLQVESIMQHWPVGGDYKVKTKIPFSDLESSVLFK